MKSWQVERMCESCGKGFLAAKYDIEKGWGKFCSRRCRADVQNKPGPISPRWGGGRHVRSDGYVGIAIGRSGQGFEHVAIAERALGRTLPDGTEVHHVNGNRSDNRNRNLVICQDAAYHKFLHFLGRVRALGGRPFLDRICSMCRRAKPLASFSPRESRCKPCNAARVAGRKAA